MRVSHLNSLSEIAKVPPHFVPMSHMGGRYYRPPPPDDLFEADTGWESSKPGDSKEKRNDNQNETGKSSHTRGREQWHGLGAAPRAGRTSDQGS